MGSRLPEKQRPVVLTNLRTVLDALTEEDRRAVLYPYLTPPPPGSTVSAPLVDDGSPAYRLTIALQAGVAPFLVALREEMKNHGGVADAVGATGSGGTALYRSLGEESHPEFSVVVAALTQLGLTVEVRAK